MYMYMYWGVLCCFALFVCLFDFACFFLSSFSSLIKTYIHEQSRIHVHVMYIHILKAIITSSLV